MKRNDYTIEYCPYCESESYIHATGITACQHCGKPLAPCSVCSDEHKGCMTDPPEACPYGCHCDSSDEFKKITMPPLTKGEIRFCERNL